MKTLIIYLVVLIISNGILFSQNLPKESELQPKPKVEAVVDVKSEFNEKVSTDSIPNTDKEDLNHGRNRKNQNRDHFIDKDGDGINDNRCNGFGAGQCKGKGRRSGKK